MVDASLSPRRVHRLEWVLSAKPPRGKRRNALNRPVSDRHSKDIVRRWNREIEAEIRREAARRNPNRRWKAVSWTALWLVWLACLVLLLTYLKKLY